MGAGGPARGVGAGEVRDDSAGIAAERRVLAGVGEGDEGEKRIDASGEGEGRAVPAGGRQEGRAGGLETAPSLETSRQPRGLWDVEEGIGIGRGMGYGGDGRRG